MTSRATVWGIGEFKGQVAGGKAGTWVSIGHFPIAGRDYWEVVMGSGDSDTTRATVEEASAILNGLVFL